jgi:uncharacterized protein (DUF1499 family)
MRQKYGIILIILIVLTGCAGLRPDLGVENGQLSNCPSTPNCVSSMTDNEKYYIEPIITTGSQSEVKAQILEILSEFKSAKVTDLEDNYIRAEFTSNLFQFVDDVEFYFPETNSEEIVIHVRSASRVGHSDFGVNRKRIEQLRNRFNERKNGLSL